MPVIAERIAANLAEVRAVIAMTCRQHGRDPQGVRLIAVTKEQTPEVLAPLVAAGVADLGENRVDHLESMQVAAPASAHFHFIGRVQGRQLPKLAPFCIAIHSLCDADHITRLGRACMESGRRMEVFIQVNVADDPAKAGVRPGELAERIDLARRTAGLEVVGLMTMAPLGPEGGQAEEATIRRCFSTLRGLAENHQLPRLSMGMSEDFTHAIAEGATDLRIGSRLFR
ncbi:MAG TPA: YggS family pyridoxal phosphate-dependent enzyme [Planctomycetota bacterium]|nr:YggS family pyridoxal phosphate-dependent enzyme [Planctomycetota bacterium]